MVHKEKHSLIKPISLLPIMLASAGVIATSIISIDSLLHFWKPSKSASQISPILPSLAPTINAVAALGRLEPQGEVIRLSAPNSQTGIRVNQLLVKKGDKIRQGQIVAVLDSYIPNLAVLEKAKRQVEVSQANFEQVKAGAKEGDISAQKATISRLEAELRGSISTQKATISRLEAELKNSETENTRYQKLYQDGAISASDTDTKKLRRDTVQEQLNEANANLKRTVETLEKQLSESQARLTSIAEIRPTDLQLAQANVKSAIASVQQAQAELNLSSILAPINGQVLKINTWPGEIIGNKGILELGQTQQMYVVAEVYETDIKKVRLGQSVTITGEAFTGTLKGTVTDIGLQVGRQNIFNTNPGSDTDNKIVNVKIRIDNPADNQRVSSLTNLQVQVLIKI
ncbi:MAG: ABC exporter membrane fusion protein [Aphanizomenon sp.]|jgi:HlyD family secretion protein|uniref:ABC transporter permease n=1 Tax=Aphanizomenon flos-aquae WA102 TaxID=1710896 RepID=A0A1B7X0E0_APHFL|nr:ABC exporter membrane fusion protein [Nostocales cyanobacterium LE14-WE12]NTW20781.1 ABC exporter membrane fusion protein [Nostocales cyanobacterium W4_Combined_metabat2_030]OBQ20518.1 MAG: ABC transporter permease [Anabaena sp. WA113]OBQ42824.1 MAG: ABC transporter permease [Aphanizomenon flos-aquae WA102]QSV65938.1 MAG: ABC exporter membrane fusion protein [Aphanizomenon flos-aquae DEX188]